MRGFTYPFGMAAMYGPIVNSSWRDHMFEKKSGSVGKRIREVSTARSLVNDETSVEQQVSHIPVPKAHHLYDPFPNSIVVGVPFASIAVVDMLRPYICTRATFNGDDRDEAPRCHRDTRKSIIGNVELWALDRHSGSGILWMTGPAGMGKSAIARKICEDLNKLDPRTLIGSFFFSKEGGDRNSLRALVPTLAYRLAVAVAEAGEFIRQALASDPFIFDRTIETQWDTLIIRPLQNLLYTSSSNRSLIVIDGLDECESPSEQSRLLHLLAKFGEYSLYQRVALLVTGRRDEHIQSELDALIRIYPRLFRLPPVVLCETEESREDMRLILSTSLNGIRRRRSPIMGDRQWPPEGAIGLIVNRAQGQFIYVCTIIRWLSDHDGNPVERLQAILKTYSNHQAFSPSLDLLSPLDSLYTLILESACSQDGEGLILPCLFLATSREWHLSCLACPIMLGQLFHKNSRTICLVLEPLHSVLQVPDDEASIIQIYDQTYLEYLLDQSRSGIYYARNQKVLRQLLTQSFQLDYKQLGFVSRFSTCD
ncbi:hypothetical protein AX16_007660, partial [Volvariella volvacea WC 439]